MHLHCRLHSRLMEAKLLLTKRLRLPRCRRIDGLYFTCLACGAFHDHVTAMHLLFQRTWRGGGPKSNRVTFFLPIPRNGRK